MAADFNGTTSKLEHTTADLGITTLLTICAWMLADGTGEGGTGGIVSLDEAGNAFRLRHGAANNLQFVSLFTTPGAWSFPATDSTAINAVGVSYDGGDVANNPIARVNFENVTVTENQTPVGTLPTPNTGYCIGNLTGQTATWDGSIGHVQVFNVILTAREMDQCLRWPGSVRRGLKLWLPMYHAGYVTDLSGSVLNGTATALTDRLGGAPCFPVPIGDFVQPYAIAAAVAARQQTHTLLGLGA